MTTYMLVKTIHILGATILFGTGIGIAFFMFRSCASSNIDVKHFAIRNTVYADTLFTLPAVILQPLTGFWLIHLAGYDLLDLWLVATYFLYLIAGMCWIPVLAIQIHLKRMLAISIGNNSELPRNFEKLFRIWILLGVPAFVSLVIIFFVMVAKPT